MNNSKGSAVVVGASLAGLMTGISLAREGIRVTLVDKAVEGQRTGAGLQVDGGSFMQSGTEKLLRDLASGGRNSIQLWTAIEQRLRKEARRQPLIDLRFETKVVSTGQDEVSAWAETDEGERIEGDMLIGEDGHRSLVRQYIAPNKPDAVFAGYLVWLASMDEAELPVEQRLGKHLPRVSMLGSFDGFMFGSIMDGPDGKAETGKRRIGCTWYDNSNNDMLYRIGAVRGNVVHHTVGGKDIPDDVLGDLIVQAQYRWPEPWVHAMLHALRTRSLIGIPIKEYVPDYLAKGHIGLIGDAAHVPAPITASGFNASLDDAVAFGKCAVQGIRGDAAVEVLEKYESMRLNKVRRIVQSGMGYSSSFGR